MWQRNDGNNEIGSGAGSLEKFGAEGHGWSGPINPLMMMMIMKQWTLEGASAILYENNV